MTQPINGNDPSPYKAGDSKPADVPLRSGRNNLIREPKWSDLLIWLIPAAMLGVTKLVLHYLGH